MAKFPADNQATLIDYYGDPATGETRDRLVKVVPPFKFTYGLSPFPHFMVHEKIAEPFKNALDKIWNYYGRDQALLDKLKISRTAGTFNPRKISGSNRWSNHAYGAAVDINSEENGFNTGHGTMPKPVVAAFKSEGFAWGGDYKGRTDPMHFEAVDRGGPERTFEEWLEHYGEPPAPPVQPIPTPPVVPVPPPAPTPVPILKRNSRGQTVRMLQQLLFVDGVFGKTTEDAVKKFQKSKGLRQDGIVGPLTWEALTKTKGTTK
jgi:hypothetical protein